MTFSSPDSASSSEPRLHDDEPRVYAVLSAENPYFADHARQVVEKFGKSATNQKRAFGMKWERPDLRILYRQVACKHNITPIIGKVGMT